MIFRGKTVSPFDSEHTAVQLPQLKHLVKRAAAERRDLGTELRVDAVAASPMPLSACTAGSRSPRRPRRSRRGGAGPSGATSPWAGRACTRRELRHRLRPGLEGRAEGLVDPLLLVEVLLELLRHPALPVAEDLDRAFRLSPSSATAAGSCRSCRSPLGPDASRVDRSVRHRVLGGRARAGASGAGRSQPTSPPRPPRRWRRGCPSARPPRPPTNTPSIVV